MAFLRVVEVLPPLFPTSKEKKEHLQLDEKIELFLTEARSIRDLSDVFLVANVKNPNRIEISTIEAAAMLQERLRVEAAPVIVTRDQNRHQFLSSILTCIVLDFKSVMIAWGDDFPRSAKVANVRDFQSLSYAIGAASLIKQRARAPTRFLAPVDLDTLAHSKGVAMARDRLRAGADLLLAQPPTIDGSETFDRHASLVEGAGLKGKVLLNVWPFKDEADVGHYEKLFGWKLSREFHDLARSGEAALIAEGRKVVGRLRKEGFPGVYLSTRGSPALARKLLS